jgi:protein SCO1/2
MKIVLNQGKTKPTLFSVAFGLSFLFVLWTSVQAFAFDETNIPSQQYSGSLRTNNHLSINEKPKVLQGVTIKENLGKQIDLSLTFADQNGVQQNFSQVLKDKPLILTLNYYRCTTLCSIQLVNLAKSIADLGWVIGKDFNMATVSFDPTDTPKDSKKAQVDYLSIAKQPTGNWNFYTGNEKNITQLAEQIGYFYKYDPVSKEYAHAAAIFFISPNGKISRYLYGINYAPNQIKFSLMDASQNKIGSPTDQILLTCFHYNPTSGKYDLFAINMLRTGAAVSVFILGFFLISFLRRDKKKFKKEIVIAKQGLGILTEKKSKDTI